jgi:hypothetical protein
MKVLLSATAAISILVLLVSPGLTGESFQSLPGPTGPGGPVRNVILYFEHDTITDKVLVPNMKDELGRTCKVTNIQAKLKEGGDIVGENPCLSDVLCVNPDGKTARVEIVGVINGKFAKSGEPIRMAGRMILDIDLTVTPKRMQGYWVFQEGVGTHYGALYVEGISEFKDPDGGTNRRVVGSGTYSGWVRKNEEKPLK